MACRTLVGGEERKISKNLSSYISFKFMYILPRTTSKVGFTWLHNYTDQAVSEIPKHID